LPRRVMREDSSMAWVMRGGWEEAVRAWAQAGAAIDAVNARRRAGETRERRREAEVFIGPSFGMP